MRVAFSISSEKSTRTRTRYSGNSMLLRASTLLVLSVAVLITSITLPNNRVESLASDESTVQATIPELTSTVYVEVNPRPFEKNVPQTMYESLTQDEVNLIEVVIQHEVGGLSADYKRLIAELIYNRILSEEFPDSVRDVLYQKNQFCGIDNWYYPEYPVDEDTRQVVKEVFSNYETSHGATYYYNPALSEYESLVWFEYSGDVTYEFEYEETSWGVTYTTRFFK